MSYLSTLGVFKTRRYTNSRLRLSLPEESFAKFFGDVTLIEIQR